MRGERYPALDGLRALATLAVIAHHAPPIEMLRVVQHFGWMGVDVFLALSGFLLGRQALSPLFHPGAFMAQRLRRIMPLYLLFAAVVAASGAGTLWWLRHALLVDDIATATLGYSSVPYTAHLWTISLEVQLYALLALVAWKRSAWLKSPAVLLALLVAMMAARVAAAGMPHPFIWALPIRADAFVFGVVASQVRMPSSAILLLATPALIPLLGAPYQIVGYTLVGIGAAALVSNAPGFLGAAPLVHVGRVSYAVYIVHLAMLAAAAQLPLPPFAQLVCATAASIALATLSYRFIEKPILHAGLKPRLA